MLKNGKRVSRGVALQRWGTTVKLTQEFFPCRCATGKEMNLFVLWSAELTWADIDTWCCIVSFGTVSLKVPVSEGKEAIRRSGMISELSVTWGDPFYFSSGIKNG